MKAKLKVSWDFNRTEIEEGTEVTIIKGMEADADGVLNAPYGMCYLCELDGVMSYVPAIYLTITDWDNIDWEQRRYEIAKEMLHAIYIDDGNAERDDDSDLNFEFKSLQGSAREAVRFADALIEELKKAK